jgi:hypothetical protein
MNRAVRYVLGLMVEEMGEALQLIGKALRFGLDTPGVKRLDGTVDMDLTPRNMLAKEIGDVRAAVDFAGYARVIDGEATFRQRETKLRKLMDPDSKDNLGRPLAPQLHDFNETSVHGWDGETF